MFYRDERLALFIDGSNLYAAAKSLGFDIDYKLLRAEFMRRGKMLRAFYYTALLENDEYSPIRPLVDWLNYNGFTMVTKPAKEYTDSMGRRKVKGNMDIELTVDAMELAPHVDHVVIFSGDGDFRPLVEALQRKGVRVSVVSAAQPASRVLRTHHPRPQTRKRASVAGVTLGMSGPMSGRCQCEALTLQGYCGDSHDKAPPDIVPCRPARVLRWRGPRD